jgi:hypothetical protein
MVPYWEDQSPPVHVLNYIGVLKLARLRTYKAVSFSPRAHMRKMAEEAAFILINNRDLHYDYQYNQEIPYQA